MKLFLFAVVILCSTSSAQFAYRGDVSLGGTTTYVGTDVTLPNGQTTRVNSAGFQVVLKTHLEGDLTFDALGFYLVLDPNLTINAKSEVEGKIGLTEVYGRYKVGEFDISSGLERLPLETARLSVPFSLSEVSSDVSADSPKGSLAGIWGARVLWYPGNYRFRLAGFYRADDEQFGVAFSAKRFFGEFELEVTPIYDNHFTFGLNGSGLIGDIVVYGETWLLLNTPLANGDTQTTLRGLLGATGYLGDSLWTLEAGYFPSFGATSSYPQLLAQWQLPQDNTTWSLGAGAGLQNEQVIGLLAANIGVSEGDVSTSFSLNTQVSREFISISTGFELKGAF
jgi:hypothetical protein